jgi:hypothetical protein
MAHQHTVENSSSEKAANKDWKQGEEREPKRFSKLDEKRASH